MRFSLYLAAQPNVWYGMARLLDLGNTFDAYNDCETGKQADSLGIFLDWNVVAQDLWAGVESYDSGIIPTTEPIAKESHLVSR
jgi:hypothetical protein